MSMIYTSRDAYNGCMSLFSKQEQLHRTGFEPLSMTLSLSQGGKGRLLGGPAFRSLLREYSIANKKKLEDCAKLTPLATIETISEIVADPAIVDENWQNQGFIFSDEKVTVAEDSRNFELMCLEFHGVEENVLRRIWSLHQSWVACCDIARSLLLSKSGTIQFQFVFNPLEWPPLRRMPILGILDAVSVASCKSSRSSGSKRMRLKTQENTVDDCGSFGEVSNTDTWSLCEDDDSNDDGFEEAPNHSFVSSSSSSCGVISLSSVDGEGEDEGSDWDLVDEEYSIGRTSDVHWDSRVDVPAPACASIQSSCDVSIDGNSEEENIAVSDVAVPHSPAGSVVRERLMSYRDVLLSTPSRTTEKKVPCHSDSHKSDLCPLTFSRTRQDNIGYDGPDEHSKICQEAGQGHEPYNFAEDIEYWSQCCYEDFLFEYAGYGNSSALTSRVRLFYKTKSDKKRGKVISGLKKS